MAFRQCAGARAPDHGQNQQSPLMQTQILVVAEHDGVQLDPITSDLVSWALKLATAKNSKVGVLVAGCSIGGVAEAACKLSTDAVYVLDDAALKDYNAPIYVESIAQ